MINSDMQYPPDIQGNDFREATVILKLTVRGHSPSVAEFQDSIITELADLEIENVEILGQCGEYENLTEKEREDTAEEKRLNDEWREHMYQEAENFLAVTIY